MTVQEQLASLKARIVVLETGAPPADLSALQAAIAAVADRVTAIEQALGEAQVEA